MTARPTLILGRIDCVIYELSEDYLSAVRVGRMEGAEGEAPAMFRIGRNWYYLVTSRLDLLAGRRIENTYFTSSSIWGPWTPRGPFAEATARKGNDRRLESAGLLLSCPSQGKPDSFIFFGDVFNATDSRLIADLRKAIHVWLPIELKKFAKDHSMCVPWRDEWDLVRSSTKAVS